MKIVKFDHADWPRRLCRSLGLNGVSQSQPWATAVRTSTAQALTKRSVKTPGRPIVPIGTTCLFGGVRVLLRDSNEILSCGAISGEASRFLTGGMAVKHPLVRS